MLVNESVFDQSILKLGHVPFEQSKGWRTYQEQRGMPYLYFVDNEAQPSIACCGRIIKKPFIGKILDITGEVISKEDLTEKVLRKFYQSLIEDAGVDLIVYNCKVMYDVKKDIALRRSGFNRPLGSRICPLTIMVDLVTDTDNNRDRNWKRNAKKAVESDLKFEYIAKPTMEDAKTVCHMFDEMSETKHLGFTLEPKSLYELIISSGYRFYYVCKDGKPLCARIVYVYRDMAEDVFAANSDDSREYSATHFMMDSVFKDLKGIGATSFDFSRIPPSNNETDSVYIFKKATGGKEVQYLGEWIWAKKQIVPLLFCIYNFYVHKSHHY